MGAKTSGNSPCASCKLLRRRCAKDCVFAPYFPPDEPHKFASVHKVFGASNVSKMLQELPVHQRGDAVKSMVYEANARMRDPVYGCVGAISYLQQQVAQLQMQLAMAQAEILCMQMRHHEALKNYNSTSDFMDHKQQQQQQHHQIATIPLQQQQQMIGSSQSLAKPPLSHHPQPSDCSATTSAYSMDEQQQHPHHHLATDSTTVDHFMDATAASDSLWS